MKIFAFRKHNERGHAHIFLALAVAALVGGIGVYTLIQSRAATASQPIVGLGGKCLDNSRNIAKDSNKINLYDCNNTTAQKWTVKSDGSIVNDNGYCLDVKASSKNEYTFVQLYRCNQTVAQQWKIDSNKYIINTHTGFCLTVHYASTANGTPLWMKGCHQSDAQKWTVKVATPPPTPTPVPTPPPTPTPTANCPGTQPTGTGLVAYQNLAGATFADKINSTSSRVSLAPGTFSFSNFGTIPSNGSVLVGASVNNQAGIIGSGIDKTVIQMNANSSNKASSVPTASGTTNQLSLMYVNKGAVKLSCFTLKGTAQGHYHNGLTMYYTSKSQVSDLKLVAAGPGYKNFPPGETFGLNDYKGTDNTYTNVEIDGAGTGASAFAGNSTSGGTWTNDYAHDNPYGAGIALWQMTGTQTLTNFKSVNNFIGINVERDNSTINVIKPTISGTKKYDVYLGNDWGSTKLNIYDPILDPGKKLVIFYPLKGTAGPSLQKKTDVHVYVNGVDKTDSIASFIGR